MYSGQLSRAVHGFDSPSCEVRVEASLVATPQVRRDAHPLVSKLNFVIIEFVTFTIMDSSAANALPKPQNPNIRPLGAP